MTWRILSGGAIAALAGAAMLAAASDPSPAFTLDSPSLEPQVAADSIEPVYWRHWGWHGGWHRGWGWRRGWGWHGGWHRWGWGWHRPGYGFYGGPVRHCWIGRVGLPSLRLVTVAFKRAPRLGALRPASSPSAPRKSRSWR